MKMYRLRKKVSLFDSFFNLLFVSVPLQACIHRRFKSMVHVCSTPVSIDMLTIKYDKSCNTDRMTQLLTVLNTYSNLLPIPVGIQ